MAQNKIASVKEEINRKRRELGAFEKQAKNQCNHKDNRGSYLVPVSEYDGFIKNRNDYGEFAMICTECGEIIDMQSITEAEAQYIILGLRSMCNQAKVLANLSDAEYEQLVEILQLVDGLETALVPFYQKIMKHLTDGNRNKNRNNGQTKGRMGKAITSSNFNRR